MGASIEAVGTSLPRRRLRREGSVDLCVRAAEESLERAGIEASDIDVLIHTGVYRDRNICEPAIAPFIQRRLGANAASPGRGGGERSTFSFDLNNGVCGWLNALQAGDGFLASGRAQRVLVVTGDVDPAPKTSVGLNFAPAAAAVVLAPGRHDVGLTVFHSESFAKHSNLMHSAIEWIGDEAPRFGPRNAVVRREDSRFLDQCVDSAARVLEGFLSSHALELSDVDLVLPTQFPAAFPERFRERTRLAPAKVADVTGSFGSAYTAGMAAAFASALAEGRVTVGSRLLFLAVGPGITVSTALYTVPEATPTRRGD
jgi:3-oxoacyl-[acyl-carrier-protein] synthase-3